MIAVESSSIKNRRVFGWIFLVSSLLLFVPDMLGQLLQTNALQADVLTQKIETSLNRFQYNSPHYLVFNTTITISLLTLLTATISLIGFIISCFLGWQKDSNATHSMVQETQKLELILADLQLELDQRRY